MPNPLGNTQAGPAAAKPTVTGVLASVSTAAAGSSGPPSGPVVPASAGSTAGTSPGGMGGLSGPGSSMNSRRRRHPEFTARRSSRKAAPAGFTAASAVAVKDGAEPHGVAEHVLPPSGLLLPPPATSPDAAPACLELHFGTLLRRAREQKGQSVQAVAEATRISVRFISALEEAKLDVLPAPVFAAGYVRSYARAVGLGEQELLARYHALVESRAEVGRRAEALVATQRRALARKARRRQALYALPCLLLVLAACAWAWLRYHHG